MSGKDSAKKASTTQRGLFDDLMIPILYPRSPPQGPLEGRLQHLLFLFCSVLLKLHRNGQSGLGFCDNVTVITESGVRAHMQRQGVLGDELRRGCSGLNL